MELTRERIEELRDKSQYPDTRTMAKMLLAEMDRPKVWEGAPDNATVAVVDYFKRTCGDLLEPLSFEAYTRELPKTRARIMAEEIASAHISNKDDLIDIIEQTINAHMEELKGEA